ncbi:dynein regulatory complex protein 1 [Ischnura elegans]|uniref:dynein regulatory complex protein 1 n=1 Tax=Ischnura elegans TaxID=197161 RepID=UPI001ED8ABAF|nr:dynein regulatory complex protein 1 [Ischnura elegans]
MSEKVDSEVNEKGANVKTVEPDINSTDPEQRKLARRLRIQRRVEASKNPKAAGEDAGHEEENEALVTSQLEKSEEILSKLLKEGQDLVTNIRVANDSREVQRRNEDLEAREKRRKNLLDEAETSMILLSEIAEGWDKIALNDDVINLHEDIQKQKEKCGNLVKEKNSLIETLSAELSMADLCYTNDLQKQVEDISLCASRIDMQVETMRRAYKAELSLLEMAINKELEDLTQECNQRWMELYVNREESANEQLKEHFERVSQQQKKVYDNQIAYAEKYRRVKIALETDIQLLQQEVQQIKAVCLMNSEKLDYNYQVLKKRDEESTILKSQQKRKITKLLDQISKLKSKIAETEHKTKVDTAKLTDEVIRLHKNIVDIEDKSEKFSEVNDKKFQGLWKMNQKNIMELLEKVLNADRVICEQQLCIEWQQPEIPLLDDIFQKPHDDRKESSNPLIGEPDCESKRKLLKHLLHRLADNSGFLLEDRLSALLVPYASREKMLVYVDGIFQALEVKTWTDMDILLGHFLPYLQCSLCDDMDYAIQMSAASSCLNVPGASIDGVEDEEKADTVDAEEKDGEEVEFQVHPMQVKSPSSVEGDKEIRKLEAEQQLPSRDDDQESQETSASSEGEVDDSGTNKFTCPNGHPLQINSIYVLKAIRDFAAHVHHTYYGGDRCKPEKLEKPVSSSRQMTKEDIENYWSRFANVLPENKERLWNSLLGGLQKYYLILQDRHKLVEDTTKLRRQNSELRQLLHRYIRSNASVK